MTDTDELLIAGLALTFATALVVAACYLPEMRAWWRNKQLQALRIRLEALHERIVDTEGMPMRGWRRDMAEYEMVKAQIEELEKQ